MKRIKLYEITCPVYSENPISVEADSASLAIIYFMQYLRKQSWDNVCDSDIEKVECVFDMEVITKQ